MIATEIFDAAARFAFFGTSFTAIAPGGIVFSAPTGGSQPNLMSGCRSV